MRRCLTLASLLGLLGCVHSAPTRPAGAQAGEPRLVVVVVFDQLRADYFGRFGSQLLPARGADGSHGGFQALIAKGAYFPVAEHDVLMTMTGPGHANISTGAWPYRHGISRNRWFVGERKAYCVEDVNAPVIGSKSSNPFDGRSPRNLRAPSLGDTLKNHDWRSKVVSVSIKDRAAILMAGHRADAAYWMNYSGAWTTSRYYQKKGDLPAWLTTINTERSKSATTPYHFKYEPSSPRSDQGAAKVDITVEKGSYKALSTPYADDLTLAVVEGAMRENKLGQDAVTDMLWVSFSGFDKAGHRSGPNSARMEAMFLAADRALARLLNHLEATVPGGMSEVVVVVTGDHGVSPNGEYARKVKLPAQRQNRDQILDRLNARMASLFSQPPRGQNWLVAMEDLNLYFNRALAAQHAIPMRRLQAVAKELLEEEPGVLMGFTRTEIAERKYPPGRWGQQTRNGYVPGRSGEVIGIPKPFVLPDADPANHYTGYSYDRQVPLIIAGPGIRRGRFYQVVQVIDIAPTLAALLGTLHPAMSEGRVLHEALTP